MSTALATTPPPGDLGFYAGAVERQPVLTLTVTGAALGVTFGIGLGLLYASVFDRKNLARSAVCSGGVWGAILGTKGYSEGRNLQSWLQSSSSSGTLVLPP